MPFYRLFQCYLTRKQMHEFHVNMHIYGLFGKQQTLNLHRREQLLLKTAESVQNVMGFGLSKTETKQLLLFKYIMPL